MSGLPSGTVTFLFTDIEGSTQLLRRLGERCADVLDRHDRLIRAACAGHGGREINTQGDAFFVAFERARDAVSAAVEIQRALVSKQWPEGARRDAGAREHRRERQTGDAATDDQHARSVHGFTGRRARSRNWREQSGVLTTGIRRR